ncbi:DEAD/DEAH box helicase [Planctomonas psychrotolerans]|uniref:DEAD/DEAH box helicase n=1 Tax=Planctomonas psychrotolerans TaxID=2528712 RepID=UPI001D0D35A3|nr:DEAD/DEAH box helicase [Planctomonas psychrotolerans]
MSSVAPPLVDVSHIVHLVGRSSFSRGQAYAKTGAVEHVEWDADARLLTGIVRGTTPQPYRCTVDLVPDGHGGSRPTYSSCSCPMSFDCKHVAAALLAGNAAHVRSLGGTNAIDAASTAEPAVAAWKSAVGALLPSGTVTPGTGVDRRQNGTGWAGTPAHTPLGLLFELREQTPRTPQRWRGSAARTAAHERNSGRDQAEAPDYRLGVRPVVRSRSGNWVRTTVTWNTIAYSANRLNLDPDQHRWFSQFPALHRAGAQVYYGQDPDWLYLDDFASPLLWHLLTDAQRLGIPLVGVRKEDTVVLGRAAEVTLDATRDAEGDLHLTPVLSVDGQPHGAATAGRIGTHGVYSHSLPAPASVVLAPTTGPLSDEQAALLGRAAETVIPATDADEFLTDFYPALRQNIEVGSSDGSVRLPEIAPPILVLTATFGAKHALRLDWDWEYRRGAAVARIPVSRPTADADAGADADAAGEVAADAHAATDAPTDAGARHGEARPSVPPVAHRDARAEHAVLDRAREVVSGWDSGTAHLAAGATLRDIDAAEFTEKVLPVLAELDGVRVDVVGTQPDYRELTEPPVFTFTTAETDRRDWFDLGVLVHVEGREVPFGPIFTALSRGKTRLLMQDGTYLSLDQPAFEQLHDLIREAQALTEWETGLRISRYQASLWSEFEDLAEDTEQAEAWRVAAAGLLDSSTVAEIPAPTSLQATLRPYQLDGFRWLAFLWQHGLGGILGDDMGLGKTVQALALLLHVKEQFPESAAPRRPFLIVAPTSVAPNWLSEAERFAPTLNVVGVSSTQKKSGTPLADAVAGADVVVTSYALFRLDFEAYRAVDWGGLILDEAQFVKNRASAVHACARDLAAPFKLAVTGTPMENNLMELWALFAVVAPGLFPSARKFTEDYSRPIERGAASPAQGSAEATVAPPGRGVTDREAAEHGAKMLARLRRRIRPLMLRRTKELVAKDLPAKQEQVLRIDLAPAHRKLYDTFLQRERQKLLGLLEDMDRNRFIVFRSLTLLRMLSLDASLVDEKYSAVPSTKLDALFEQLDDVVAEGHRALIFSQFTTFLGRAAAGLERRGIPYSYLDGSTTRRAEVIDAFKGGTAPVFLISLKAGGFGLNLTEADYVFLLDPWWNPATEEQAVDRTHRIGQTKNVMVYRMVATGTIEEKVMALKEKKARLFSSMMDDDAVFSSALTADDIRGLLDA